jgi:hypothetical protein
VQGRNATEHVGSELARIGPTGRAVIVASARHSERLSATRVNSRRRRHSVDVHTFGGESSQADINAGANAARQPGGRTVIYAHGLNQVGGSVLTLRMAIHR